MNPFLSNELAGEHMRDLREEAARGGRWPRRTSSADAERHAGLTLRHFGERDIDAIRRLAALDEKPVPAGGVLVAELDGELVAALPLDGGEALADPFKPTAGIVELLRLRAEQLRESGPRTFALPRLAARRPVRKLA